MNKVAQHLKDSKITTSAAGILALLSLFGLEGDPETINAIRALLEANMDTIVHSVAIILLLFAKDPKKDKKCENPKDGTEEN